MYDVLICAYNAANTLLPTLSSLALQRLSKKLNIYLIDDGSTEEDKKEYAKYASFYKDTFNSFTFHPRIENKGIGATRNEALKISKENTNSPWVFFLDADDYLNSPYAFNILEEAINLYPDAKCIHTPVIQENFDTTKMGIDKGYDYKNAFLICKGGNILYLHGRIYSRAAIEESGLYFPEYRSNEDTAFNLAFFHLYNKPNEIILYPHKIVCTCWNPFSITRSPYSSRQSYGVNNPNELFDCYYSSKETFNIFKQKLKEKGILPTLKNSSNFVDRWLMAYIYYNPAFSKSEEEDYLCKMAIVMYYKDIIKECYNNNPLFASNLWFTDSSFVWNEEPKPTGDIFKKIKEWEKSFDIKKIEELSPKFLTNYGYYTSPKGEFKYSAFNSWGLKQEG